MRKKSLVFLWLLTGWLSVSGFAAEVQAVRVAAGPKIDGRLDDPAWTAAVPFSDFRMAEPLAGGEASERTELRIVYDESHLYIGIRCHDSEAARITAHSMLHDSGKSDSHWGGQGTVGTGDDDVVRVLLDPFMDKRSGYFFTVNPRGARGEGLASGGSASLNWDGIWDAAGRIDTGGWSAELEIPFKTIQFRPELTAWGINIERFIARKGEKVRLSGTDRDSNFFNPMAAASLTGIAGVRQGKGITIRPYGLLSVEKDHADTSGSQWQLDGGVDIYKNFTPNLVGAFSYNMDFAETEADERRINLTRFPLFFPEKRMFFLEGSETFNFSASVSFQPFFSRKIGLFQGEQVPLLFGAKVYGKSRPDQPGVPGRADRKILRAAGAQLPGPAPDPRHLQRKQGGLHPDQRQPVGRTQHPARGRFPLRHVAFSRQQELQPRRLGGLQLERKDRGQPCRLRFPRQLPQRPLGHPEHLRLLRRSARPGTGFHAAPGHPDRLPAHRPAAAAAAWAG